MSSEFGKPLGLVKYTRPLFVYTNVDEDIAIGTIHVEDFVSYWNQTGKLIPAAQNFLAVLYAQPSSYMIIDPAGGTEGATSTVVVKVLGPISSAPAVYSGQQFEAADKNLEVGNTVVMEASEDNEGNDIFHNVYSFRNSRPIENKFYFAHKIDGVYYLDNQADFVELL